METVSLCLKAMCKDCLTVYAETFSQVIPNTLKPALQWNQLYNKYINGAFLKRCRKHKQVDTFMTGCVLTLKKSFIISLESQTPIQSYTSVKYYNEKLHLYTKLEMAYIVQTESGGSSHAFTKELVCAEPHKKRKWSNCIASSLNISNAQNTM